MLSIMFTSCIRKALLLISRKCASYIVIASNSQSPSNDYHSKQVTNDGWRDGAQNHQPATEGNWYTRVDVGLRAWFEWLPTRQFTSDKQRFYREFTFGNLVQLNMLDTRYDDRDQQVQHV
jgi:PhoD-like phosphatase